jgi:alcohol dehydrogenase class IV
MAHPDLRRFSAPPYIISGVGALDYLAGELRGLGATRVAIACDRGVERAGLLTRMQEAIGDTPCAVCALVDPDPTVEDAEHASARAIEGGSDVVVALGGGSALAIGKAVALRLRNPRPIDSYAGRDQADALPAPCVGIPTTAGSGSEVSNALTLHDPEQEQILVVRGRDYEPRVALLDGTLLETLPERPMIEAGLDALSHALEALWALNASSFTDALAVAAAQRICSVLPDALEHRRTADLQALLEASAMANLACGNAGLGLVHALSSAAAVRLSHGYQNGVLLPAVAQFNRPELTAPAAAVIDRGLALYEQIGFAPRFAEGDLTADDVRGMVAAALTHDFRANNVRAASESDLRDILAASGAPAPSGLVTSDEPR